MKLLFLDIDGVLNTSGSVLARTGPVQTEDQQLSSRLLKDAVGELSYTTQFTHDTIDNTAVGLVNRLFDKDSELRLVLSSTHRNKFKGQGYGSADHLRKLSLYMRLLGIRQDVYAVTPTLGKRRGEEVQTWLDEIDGEIEHYAILDDDSDFDPRQPLVRCDATLGFTAKEYYQISNLLGIVESPILFA